MVTRVFRNDRGNGEAQAAFTLIELLVVIAIIALLIAILLPSLEAARRQSKMSVCLAHIKNIATSSRVYEADDTQGWGIPVHPLQYRQGGPQQTDDELVASPIFIGAYEWGGKSGIGQSDFVTGSPTPDGLGSKYGTRAGLAFDVKSGFGPATRPMNDILYPGGFKDAFLDNNPRLQAAADTKLDLGLFRCPADDGPPRGAHCEDWINDSTRSSYDHFGNSYASNVFMVVSDGNCLDHPRCEGRFLPDEMGSNSPYMRPISRVPTPSRTLYYEENIGRWAWSCKNELTGERGECQNVVGGTGVDPGPTKTLAGWHGKDWTFNRAFVDAHAETQRIIIEGTEDSEGYSFHYRNECPPANVNNDCEPCIRVRGDGWQKDTLPAEFVRTLLKATLPGRPSYEGCVQTE